MTRALQGKETPASEEQREPPARPDPAERFLFLCPLQPQAAQKWGICHLPWRNLVQTLPVLSQTLFGFMVTAAKSQPPRFSSGSVPLLSSGVALACMFTKP